MFPFGNYCVRWRLRVVFARYGTGAALGGAIAAGQQRNEYGPFIARVKLNFGGAKSVWWHPTPARRASGASPGLRNSPSPQFTGPCPGPARQPCHAPTVAALLLRGRALPGARAALLDRRWAGSVRRGLGWNSAVDISASPLISPLLRRGGCRGRRGWHVAPNRRRPFGTLLASRLERPSLAGRRGTS